MADRSTQTEVKVDMSTQTEIDIDGSTQKFKYITRAGEVYHSRSSCVALPRSKQVKKFRECKFCREFEA